MPLKARLLTFAQLPNRQLVGDLSPLTQVYEQLDSTTTFFENCYLQAIGLQSILGHAAAISAVPDLLTAPNRSAVFVQLGEPAEPMRQENIPEWITQKFSSSPNDAKTASEGYELAWLHCHLKMRPESAEQDAETFDACLQALRGLDSESQSPLIITSVDGVSPPEDLPFESRLFDSRIRVPLWVETAGHECRRVQSVSGSFDVLETVWQTLQAGVNAVTIPVTNNQAPRCLLDLMAESGRQCERRLLVRAKDAIAIRTESFLFVQDDQTGMDKEANFAACALYSKPADIWNVHDVSAEYHELVNEFSRELAQHIR